MSYSYTKMIDHLTRKTNYDLAETSKLSILFTAYLVLSLLLEGNLSM